MTARILTLALLGIVRGVALGLGLLARGALAVLGRAGVRGGRLVALAATVLLVYGWAAPAIGLRPAGWLAVIGWTAWLARHQPAQLDHSAAMRRLTAQVDRYARSLAQATRRPAPATTPTPAARPGRPAQRPSPAAKPVPADGGLEPIFPRLRWRRNRGGA